MSKKNKWFKKEAAGGGAIDVGVNNGGTGLYLGDGFTGIVVANPANETGTITNVEFYIESSASEVYIGTFELISGNNYICRSAQDLGLLANGFRSEACSLSITAGHHIGIWSSKRWGAINTGGGDMRYVSGNTCVVDNDTTYSAIANYEPNLYGTG